jgi:hypothetical protein
LRDSLLASLATSSRVWASATATVTQSSLALFALLGWIVEKHWKETALVFHTQGIADPDRASLAALPTIFGDNLQVGVFDNGRIDVEHVRRRCVVDACIKIADPDGIAVVCNHARNIVVTASCSRPAFPCCGRQQLHKIHRFPLLRSEPSPGNGRRSDACRYISGHGRISNHPQPGETKR